MGTIYKQHLVQVLKQYDDGSQDITISSDSVDRMGEVIEQDGWQLEHYLQNPIVLYMHDWRSVPIGKTLELRREEGALVARFAFREPANAFDPVTFVRSAWDQGILRAASVGFDSLDNEPMPGQEEDFNPPLHYLSHELLEWSIVTIPANTDALRRMLRAFDGLSGETVRGAIPPHESPKCDMDQAWDAGAEVGRADGRAQLRRMHAWVDDDGDPDAKSSYKLPHHLADGRVVWRGVAAAMTALLGGRGGVSIPDGDREGVYRHLARHYRQFDKEPPELSRSLSLPDGSSDPANPSHREVLAAISSYLEALKGHYVRDHHA